MFAASSLEEKRESAMRSFWGSVRIIDEYANDQRIVVIATLRAKIESDRLPASQ
jgi:hypothetical protein